MQAVNIKELKARLSFYIRQVRGGETFLVTDRNQVVARLGPVDRPAVGAETDLTSRLVALGARPPVRARRPTDYNRSGAPGNLSGEQIDALVDWARGEAAASSADR